MARTPIFDALRSEMPGVLCRICGRTCGDDYLCVDCWMRDLDDPAEAAKWHCVDCGEFLDSLDRHVITVKRSMERWEQGTPEAERYTYEPIWLCREHYDERKVIADQFGIRL